MLGLPDYTVNIYNNDGVFLIESLKKKKKKSDSWSF